MQMPKYVRGTCEQMCSNSEVQKRTKERILHYFEQNPPPSIESRKQGHVCVAEFTRSAAGGQTPRPGDLRSPAALKRTVEYLIDRVLFDSRKSFWFVYEFVFDRLRSVRQEIVIQNLPMLDTIQLLEPIVMFLAYSSYKLCEVPIGQFDPYICNQHLQECLKKLLCCYDEIQRREDSTADLPNRHILEAMYLVLNLGSTEAMSRGIRLPIALRSIDCGLVQNCIGMSMAYYGQHYYRVLQHMKRLPAIVAALAAAKIQIMRRDMLLKFSAAYTNKMLSVPISWLSEVLAYSNTNDLMCDLKHYKCVLTDDRTAVKFNRTDFDRTVDVIKPRQEASVNELFAVSSSVVDILLFQQ